MKRYKAKLDNIAQAVTVIVLLVVLYIAYRIYEAPTMLSLAIFIAVIITIIITFIYKPSYYTVDNKGVHIKRFINELTIPLSKISYLERAVVEETGSGLRLFGSGGFLGYLGTFYYKAYGKVSMHCTDKSKMVLIVTHEKNFMISPDDPDEFLIMVNKIRSSK